MRFERRMSDADALMWRNEKDPMLRSTIVAVAVLDQAPDRALLLDRLDRTSRLVPRLRQRVVHSPMSMAPPRWEADPNFDLSSHLRWFGAPAGDGQAATLDDVLRSAEPVAMQGFDRARPLWEMLVIEGLADGGAAIVLKLHHSISDGVGFVQIAMNLFDVGRTPSTALGPMPDAPQAEALGIAGRMVDAFDHESRRWLGIARRLPATLGQAGRAVIDDPTGARQQVLATAASAARMLATASRPASPIMQGRSLRMRFAAVSVPLDEMKAAARRADGRLNDAFVAGVLGGLRRYHDSHDCEVAALRMTMPINIRSADNADLAGNAFAPARFVVPLDIDDVIERMRVVRALVQQQRAEPAMVLLDPMALVVQRLPTSVSTAFFQSMLKGQDFVTSNVPGVPLPLFVAGAAIEAQYAFGPLSGAGANLTLLSYQDQVHIGINSDPAAIPDADLFTSCLRDSLDEIRKLA